MSYTPTIMPEITDVESLRRWVEDEFRKVSDGALASNGAKLIPLYAEPNKYSEGLVVYADGTSWNPGYGAGLYVRTASGWAPVSLPYEEGNWTPVISFATPGNLAVTYAQNIGRYVRIGNLVQVQWKVFTSAFTHTTASGNLFLSGLPFGARDFGGGGWRFGQLAWQGITKANYTDINPTIPGGGLVQFFISGSGQTRTSVTAADMPSGGSVILEGGSMYLTDDA